MLERILYSRDDLVQFSSAFGAIDQVRGIWPVVHAHLVINTINREFWLNPWFFSYFYSLLNMGKRNSYVF